MCYLTMKVKKLISWVEFLTTLLPKTNVTKQKVKLNRQTMRQIINT